MDIRPAEISAILKAQISNFGSEASVTEVGQVLSVGDGIARVYGLDKVQAGEMVEFETGVRGMALNLESDNVGVVIFGSDRDIKDRRRLAARDVAAAAQGRGHPADRAGDDRRERHRRGARPPSRLRRTTGVAVRPWHRHRDLRPVPDRVRLSRPASAIHAMPGRAAFRPLLLIRGEAAAWCSTAEWLVRPLYREYLRDGARHAAQPPQLTPLPPARCGTSATTANRPASRRGASSGWRCAGCVRDAA